MMSALFAHLTGSSVFAAILCGLAFAVRRRPAMRHGLFTVAVLKFAVPFAWCVAWGEVVGRHLMPHRARPILLLQAPAAFVTGSEPVQATGVRWWVVALLSVWALLAVLSLLRWATGWWRVSRLETEMAGVEEERLLGESVARLRLRRVPALRLSREVESPCVRGVLRPELVMPCGLLQRLGPEAMEAVLLHELAHVQRWDNVLAALVHAVVCMFPFYVPLWWLERRVRVEAELACDLAVLEAGVRREAYLSGLLEVCRSALLRPVAGFSAMSAVNLSERMERIMAQRVVGRTSRWMARMGGGMLVSGCGLAFALGVLSSNEGAAEVSAAGGGQVATGQGCAAGSTQPFPVGTVVRHMPRGQMQVCVLEGGKRPVWLTLAPKGVPEGYKVVDVADPPPAQTTLSCKETAPHGKLCTCADLEYSPGAVVKSPRGALVCPASGGRWQLYQGRVTPWPPVSLME